MVQPRGKVYGGTTVRPVAGVSLLYLLYPWLVKITMYDPALLMNILSDSLLTYRTLCPSSLLRLLL